MRGNSLFGGTPIPSGICLVGAVDSLSHVTENISRGEGSYSNAEEESTFNVCSHPEKKQIKTFGGTENEKNFEKGKAIASIVTGFLLLTVSLAGCIESEYVKTLGWNHANEEATAATMYGLVYSRIRPDDNYEGYIFLRYRRSWKRLQKI